MRRGDYRAAAASVRDRWACRRRSRRLRRPAM